MLTREQLYARLNSQIEMLLQEKVFHASTDEELKRLFTVRAKLFVKEMGEEEISQNELSSSEDGWIENTTGECPDGKGDIELMFGDGSTMISAYPRAWCWDRFKQKEMIPTFQPNIIIRYRWLQSR